MTDWDQLSNKGKRIYGFISVIAGLISGIIYFGLVRPLHAGFAGNMENGLFYYYLFLFIYSTISLVSLFSGIRIIYVYYHD